MPSPLLKSSLIQHRAIPIQSWRSKILQRIFLLCSGGLPSMPLLAQLVRSSQIYPSGINEKRRQRPRARNSPSDHQFRHVAGTSPQYSMQTSGRNAQDRLYSSKSGRAPVGVGSKFASLAETCRMVSRWEARNLFDGVINGGCILLLRGSSRALVKSRNKLHKMHKQRFVQST